MNDTSSSQTSASDAAALVDASSPARSPDAPAAQVIATTIAREQEHDGMTRGTARVASATALRQVVGSAMLAVTAAVVARSLGASEFGLFAGGTAAGYLAAAFTDLGFSLVAAREMAKHPEAQARLFAATLQIQLIWSAVIGVALFGVGVITGGTRGQVMVVLSPAIVVGGFKTARQIFTVRYRAGPLIVVDISTTALQAVAMITLALLHTGVVPIAGALSVCSCLNTLVVVALARRLIERAKVSNRDRLPILRMAIPLGIASLLASLYFTIDQAILGWLVSSRQLGEYAAAVKVLSMVVMIPGFVMAASVPGLARSGDDRVMLSRFAGMVAHWLAVTALPLAIGLMIFAGPAVSVAFGHAYAASAGLLRILMTAGVVALASNVLGIVLVSVNVVRGMLVFNTLSLALNIAGNIVLAPRYGVAASAWLTTACELIVTSYAVVALRHRVSYRIVLARLQRPIIATLLAAGVGLSLGANHAYAIPPAIATFALALIALRAWPAELLPMGLKRVAARGATQ